MKSFLSFVFIFAAALTAQAASLSPLSKKIAVGVEAIKPLAQSGVDVYKIKPNLGLKESMFALAKVMEYEYPADSWVGNSSEAWGADSMSWGSATMKEAYSYIFDLDDQTEEYLNQPENKKEKEKYLADLKIAKASFKNFLGTGVNFGIAPIGAVQCGVRFAALVIVDPHSGTCYVFAKEGSGC